MTRLSEGVQAIRAFIPGPMRLSGWVLVLVIAILLILIGCMRAHLNMDKWDE